MGDVDRDASTLAPGGGGAPTSRPTRVGPYAILSELGRGAMGAVYLARRADLGGDVALKVILPQVTTGGTRVDADMAWAETVARFQREARMAARLAGQPGLVGVHDVGEADGHFYLAMDRVEGRSLDVLLDEEPLAPRRAATIFAAAARALGRAHALGVLHRDLKPSNLLITADDEPWITDFGLARPLDAAAMRLTQADAVLGTPPYMPPEQAEGDTLDARADVYALGATLYEALTGRPPVLYGPVPVMLRQILRDMPTPPRVLVPEIPAALDAIVMRTLAKLPERRYASAGALAEDLERFLAGTPVLARAVTRRQRLAWWTAAHPAGAALAGAALLCAGAGAPLAWHAWRAERAADATATLAADVGATSELAAQLAVVFRDLVRDSLPACRRLDDHWHGVPLAPAEVTRLLAEVQGATDSAAAKWPQVRLPAAWWGAAAVAADREADGLAALAAARADAGADPFPALCLARVRLGQFVREALPPGVRFTETRAHIGRFVEHGEMSRWRGEAADALADALRSPAWASLPAGQAARAFADAARRLATDDPAGAAAALAPLADDPWLGADATALRGIAAHAEGRFEEAAGILAPLVARGWTDAAFLSGMALAVAANAAAVGDADARPLAGRAIATLDPVVGRLGASRDLSARRARGICHLLMAEAAVRDAAEAWAAVEAALDDLEAVCAADPADVDAAAERARAFAVRGDAVAARGGDAGPDWARALAALDGVCAQPNADRSRTEYRAMVASRLVQRAVTREEDPTPFLAPLLAGARTAAASGPERPQAMQMLADALILGGLAALHLGRPDAEPCFREAITALDAGIARAPDTATLLASRGGARMLLAEMRGLGAPESAALVTAALADLDAALARDPTLVAARSNRARMRMLSLAPRAAAGEDTRPVCEQIFEDVALALRATPGQPQPRTVRAHARYHLARVVAREGGDPRPHLAEVVTDLDAAIGAGLAAVHAPRLRADARLFWASAEQAAGGDPGPILEAALPDCEAVCRATPDDPEAHFRRGTVLEQLRRPAEAAVAYARVAELDPAFPPVAEAQARVRDAGR